MHWRGRCPGLLYRLNFAFRSSIATFPVLFSAARRRGKGLTASAGQRAPRSPVRSSNSDQGWKGRKAGRRVVGLGGPPRRPLPLSALAQTRPCSTAVTTASRCLFASDPRGWRAWRLQGCQRRASLRCSKLGRMRCESAAAAGQKPRCLRCTACWARTAPKRMCMKPLAPWCWRACGMVRLSVHVSGALLGQWHGGDAQCSPALPRLCQHALFLSCFHHTSLPTQAIMPRCWPMDRPAVARWAACARPYPVRLPCCLGGSLPSPAAPCHAGLSLCPPQTHTMLGRAASATCLAGGLGDEAGVIPRSFDDLFRWLASQAGQASVQCSVVETYMEKVRGQPSGSQPRGGLSGVGHTAWLTHDLPVVQQTSFPTGCCLPGASMPPPALPCLSTSLPAATPMLPSHCLHPADHRPAAPGWPLAGPDGRRRRQGADLAHHKER